MEEAGQKDEQLFKGLLMQKLRIERKTSFFIISHLILLFHTSWEMKAIPPL